MSNGQSFVDTLKRIKYPEADKLDGSSFDYMFEHDELLPFLMCFCNTIDEGNIIKPDELSEYESLLSNELLNESLFEKALQFTPTESESTEEELRNEVADLQSEFSEIEKSVKILEKQISDLRLHEVKLSKKTEFLEDLLSSQKKACQILRDEIIPDSEKKVVSDLHNLLAKIQELECYLKKSSEHGEATNFFHLNIQPFIKLEEGILGDVNLSFCKLLKDSQKGISCDSEDGLCMVSQTFKSMNKYASESCIMKENLKTCEEFYIRTYCEHTKAENELKFCKEKVHRDNYYQSSEQLLMKLEGLEQTFAKLKIEENQLLNSIPDVLSNYVQTHYDWISVLCYREEVKYYKDLLMKQEWPLHILYDQGSRLELLAMCLEVDEDYLKSVSNLMLDIATALRKENQSFLKREEQMSEILKEDALLEVASISGNLLLSTLSELLGNDFEKEVFYLTADNLLSKAKELQNTEKELEENEQSAFHLQMQNIKIIESNLRFFEVFLYEREWNTSFHPGRWLQELSVCLNKTELKQRNLEELILEIMKQYNKKQKLIQQNTTIKRARHLFASAIVNPREFHRHIQQIMLQLENFNA